MFKNLSELLEMFDDDISTRGLDIYESEGVIDVEIKGDEILFSVLGRYNPFYNVTIKIVDDNITNTSCDCPYFDDCKHIYACLLYIEDHHEELYLEMQKELKNNLGKIELLKNTISNSSKEELEKDIIYLYMNDNFSKKYINEKYLKIEGDIFNKIKEVIDDYLEALSILDDGYDTHDEYELDERFYLEEEFGEYEYFLNDSYYDVIINGIISDLHIKLNVNKQQEVISIVFKLYELFGNDDYDRAEEIFDDFHNEIIKQVITFFDESQINKWSQILLKIKETKKYLYNKLLTISKDYFKDFD